MFDLVEIIVKAGDGGDGAVSFRREKFVPFGGPDGGDGGDGGDIIIRVDSSVSDLRDLAHKRFYQAKNGLHGRGQKKHGKKGENKVLAVPLGTVVLNKTQIGGEPLIADLEEDGQQVVVAKGGSGGRGNLHFASSTNQTPRIAQRGEAGEEKAIILELRLIADVGLIGYPNVGKSTLLSAVSAAKPKIAGYPFTTLEPVLGVVEVGQQSFVLAEIPGIIDGAHYGRGLGHEFLRHIMRTKMLLHLVDGSSAAPNEDVIRVNAELNLFDSVLGRKPQLVAVNKIDLPEVQARLEEITDSFNSIGISPYLVSAATAAGLPDLMAAAWEMLQTVAAQTRADNMVAKKVFHPRPKSPAPRVYREGDAFVVVAPQLERIVARIDLTDPGMLPQLNRQLARLRVSLALKKAGAKPGDLLRCGKLEWRW